MKKKILFLLLIVFALSLGNVSKSDATYVVPEPTDYVRDMASCGPGCYCCLNNTSTSCGAALCN